ncbi:DNA polymerase III subunit epsilon [bacterium HR40]|nr:DNA polymerase III subunit epsilon [bacterium HR40]
MLREIVLDTETTGLDPAEGHRIVEIGAVELVGHLPSGRYFQRYVDPERDIPEAARRVHNLTREFLAGKPRFAEIVDELLAFLGDSPLVIHNAAFDLSFLNFELERCGRPPIPPHRVIDTLTLAQRKFPGQPNSLDALCRRFGVDLSARNFHGALLDSRILAEVYLHLIGGRQGTLALAPTSARTRMATRRTPRPPRPHAASAAELEAHRAFIATIPNALWNEASTATCLPLDAAAHAAYSGREPSQSGSEADGQDQGEEPGGGAGRGRDGADHLAHDPRAADPAVPRHRPRLL